jgi:hypothetical protein
VRHRQLLQIGGRTGENKRGKWGRGVSSVPRGGKEMGERGGEWRSAARGEGRDREWPPTVGHGRRRYCTNRGERRGTGDAVRCGRG